MDAIEGNRVFAVGEPMWHQKGRLLETAPQTVTEALAAASANWEVTREPVYTKRKDGTYVEVPRYRAIVRDEDEKAISVVGTRFRSVQNRDSWNTLDPLLQSGAARFESAGVLHDGALVWGMVKFNTPLEVLPGDVSYPYVVVTNHHSSTSSNTGTLTCTRVVCWNTLQIAQRTGKHLFSIRHTKNAAEALEAAKGILISVEEQGRATAESYKLLAKAQANTEKLTSYFKHLLLQPEQPELTKPATKVLGRLLELCETGKGSDIPGVRGTLWGGYNALTEFVDHYQGVPTGTKTLTAAKADAMLQRSMFGDGAKLKKRALDSALALV